MDKRIVGIDVAKHWLDICAADSKRVERIDNTAEAICAWLKRSPPRAQVLRDGGTGEGVGGS